MFSFVLLDESVTPSRIIAARDPIGITTLYQGWSSQRPGAVFFASELKALTSECDKIITFPPGHVYDSVDESTTRYFQPTWWDGDSDNATIPNNTTDFTRLREALEAAVKKRLMSEVPYGVLLSGGLDSSLIAAIAARETEKVAQAQAEVRRKKLAETSSGPGTPTNSGVVSEYGMLTLCLVSCCQIETEYQKRLLLGLNSILSPLGSRTLQIYWLPVKLLIIWAQCITSTFLLCKKASTPSQMSYTTSRHMMSPLSAPVHQCISSAER